MKNDKPEEYEMILSSIKEVIKDITRLEVEIIEETRSREWQKEEKSERGVGLKNSWKNEKRQTKNMKIIM